jgi:membrane protein implicated in regulation of membrane protease activity
MIIAMFQKTATSELWWIGSALILFLTALLLVSSYKYFKNRSTRDSESKTPEGEQVNSDADAHL